MPRLRKLRRKQKFQYHVNRRRLNEKHSKLPRINCDAVRQAWDDKKSMTDNLTNMGLVADPNRIFRTIRVPPKKQDDKDIPESSTEEATTIANTLEEEAKQAYSKKNTVAHPLPPEMAKKLCRFLDKHGEDYEAMVRDPTNFYQETAAQLRSQVKRLKKVPQQWIPYLKSRGLLQQESTATDSQE